MKKSVYIVMDIDYNLLFSRSAFQSKQDALDYATAMDKIRLANGFKIIDYQIVEFTLEKPLIKHALSENT